MGRIIPYIMENKTCLKPPTIKVPMVPVMFDGHPSQVSWITWCPAGAFPTVHQRPAGTQRFEKRRTPKSPHNLGCCPPTGNWQLDESLKKIVPTPSYTLLHPQVLPKMAVTPTILVSFHKSSWALRVMRSYGSITSVSILQSKLPQFKLDSFTHHISM